MTSDKEVRKYDHTHNWKGGGEMWVCKNCGGSKIELGFWGDDNWRKKHKGWTIPCPAFTKFWSKFNFPKEFTKDGSNI